MATTLEENSNALPPSNATRSSKPPSSTSSRPRIFSMLVLAIAYACSRLIVPSASNALYSRIRSNSETIPFCIGEVHTHAILNRVFLACEGYNPLPSPTVTLCARRVVTSVSFVSGGPSILFRHHDQGRVGRKVNQELTLCVHST